MTAPPRLQRILLTLQKYDLNVVYKPGKEMFIADTLSRAFLPESSDDIVPDLTINSLLTSYLPVSPVMCRKLQEETAKDRELQTLQDVVLEGWPETKVEVKCLDTEYQALWLNKSQLKHLDHSSVTWDCLNCGLPNFSSTLFDTSPTDISNKFSHLHDTSTLSSSDDPKSPGPPKASSSPKKQTTPPNTTNRFIKPTRIATINFQSISNKKPELEHLLHTLKPDIVIGTETWLNNNIPSHEYFPSDSYTTYRKDRTPNKKGQSHGGVLIAVTNAYHSEHAKELDTDNESIYININMTNSHDLTVGAYYRPSSDKGKSIEHLEDSINRIGQNNNRITYISGDFNLPHIDWHTNTTIPSTPQPKLHQHLLNIINDKSLTQTTASPTRGEHILDLTLTNRPSIINKQEILPPLGKSDHDIVYTEIDVRLKKIRRPPRDILIYNKANWDNIKTDLEQLNTQLDERSNDNIEEIWHSFKTTLNKSIDKNIPTKHITHKSKLPWITRPIRQLINKSKRLHKQYKSKPEIKHKYKATKSELQKQTRNAYLNYLEKMITDIPIDEPRSSHPNKKHNPKKLFSYIKTTKKENSDITVLRKDGQLLTDTTDKANILNQQFQSAFTQWSIQPYLTKDLHHTQLCQTST
ncbi:uncharacterized protein [Argopecten irradians]|uniref:uncharacterized protein n=1 Tax=Argopecten irradians TaxID=31199 RepID=UPI0037197E1C